VRPLQSTKTSRRGNEARSASEYSGASSQSQPRWELEHQSRVKELPRWGMVSTESVGLVLRKGEAVELFFTSTSHGGPALRLRSHSERSGLEKRVSDRV